jgi:hypothetical protein
MLLTGKSARNKSPASLATERGRFFSIRNLVKRTSDLITSRFSLVCINFSSGCVVDDETAS